MFDLAWSEIALIGVVALIAIGPKDLPVAIKACAEMVKKARRMASEFQGHVDEMVREANLHEVRDQISELRNMDIKGKILNAVDDDGSLRRTINDDVFKTDPFKDDAFKDDAFKPGAYVPPASDTPALPEPAPEPDPALAAPAFIPPGDAPQEAYQPAPAPPQAPAFIPPGAERPPQHG